MEASLPPGTAPELASENTLSTQTQLTMVAMQREEDGLEVTPQGTDEIRQQEILIEAANKAPTSEGQTTADLEYESQFPRLVPTGTASVGEPAGRVMQKDGSFRFTFECRKVKAVESAKRPPPQSPAGAKSAKRHTLEANPPFTTPVRPPPTQTQSLEDPPSPTLNTRRTAGNTPHGTATLADPETAPRHPELAASEVSISEIARLERVQLKSSEPGPPQSTPTLSKSITTQNQTDTPIFEGDPFNMSTTLVAGSDWDDILVDSPPRTPVATSFQKGKGIDFPLDKYKGMSFKRLPPEVPSVENTTITPMSPAPADLLQGPPAPHLSDEASEANAASAPTVQQMTERPNGGWPTLHQAVNPLENVADIQIEAWKKATGAKLWAREFRAKFEHNSLPLVDKTRSIIKSLAQIEDDELLGVSFPLQKQASTTDRFPPPFNMLISGLTEAQAAFLAGLEVVSTKEITILFMPFDSQRPSFALTICGLTFMHTERASAMVTSLVKNRFLDSKEIVTHIGDCAPMSKDLLVRDITDGITVKYIEVKRSPANGGDFRGWNVYLPPTNLNDSDHVKLINIMRTCDFPTAANGYGFPLRGRDVLQCVNCKSIDHDTPNCPFPDLPGWLGYKPNASAASASQQKAYNDMIRYNDGAPRARGRGWGRGRGGRGGGLYGGRGGRGNWN
ncbi:hypothetical protein C0992_002483 [Termitomyces sp. T32_za158]|nr:hypothetical protein C0992_002483 [Termitomyces sp. T32_za158]